MAFFDKNGIDRFHRSFVHALNMGEQVVEQFNQLLMFGPKVEVFDRGNQVEVRVEAPGMVKERPYQWRARTIDRHLYLSGRMNLEQSMREDDGRFYSERHNEQFQRYVPLPAPIDNTPSTAKYRNGLLVLLFDKNERGGDGEWHPFHF